MEIKQADASIKGYVIAAWREWKVLVGGGAGIVIILQAAEHISGQNISWRWYAGLLAYLVVWACYRAWRNERNTLNAVLVSLEEEKQKSTPDLRGELKWASFGAFDVPPYHAVVTLFVRISNLGAKSIARDYTMSLDLPDSGRVTIAPTHFEGTITLNRDNQDGVVFNSEDALYIKTGTQSIETGSMAEGSLIFVLNDVSRDEVIAAKSSIVLSFFDVTGKLCTAELKGDEHTNAPIYLPGVPTRLVAPQKVKREKKSPVKPKNIMRSQRPRGK